jgi:hypothetical protein
VLPVFDGDENRGLDTVFGKNLGAILGCGFDEIGELGGDIEGSGRHAVLQETCELTSIVTSIWLLPATLEGIEECLL